MTPRSTRSGLILALAALLLLFSTPFVLGNLGVPVAVNGLLSGALLGAFLLAMLLQPWNATGTTEEVQRRSLR